MKQKLITVCPLLLALAGVHLNAAPLGTAFTYQGKLNDGGSASPTLSCNTAAAIDFRRTPSVVNDSSCRIWFDHRRQDLYQRFFLHRQHLLPLRKP